MSKQVVNMVFIYMKTDFIIKRGNKYFEPIYGYDEDEIFSVVDEIELDDQRFINWHIEHNRIIEEYEKSNN